jgi:hypothetical protein
MQSKGVYSKLSNKKFYKNRYLLLSQVESNLFKLLNLKIFFDEGKPMVHVLKSLSTEKGRAVLYILVLATEFHSEKIP